MSIILVIIKSEMILRNYICSIFFLHCTIIFMLYRYLVIILNFLILYVLKIYMKNKFFFSLCERINLNNNDACSILIQFFFMHDYIISYALMLSLPFLSNKRFPRLHFIEICLSKSFELFIVLISFDLS